MTKGTAVSLAVLVRDAFLGRADVNTLSGPVGIVGIVGDAADFGFVYLMSFTALISINLAIINLIPFPALDGGRLLFLLIEKIKGSRISPRISNTLNTVGFFILIALMLVVTYHDIVKLV
ncbi:MAG: regulator of sigma protease [Patescibacteria group bacterium]|nr:regulator of sigma protease [Patescibacteria group bacterium]